MPLACMLRVIPAFSDPLKTSILSQPSMPWFVSIDVVIASPPNSAVPKNPEEAEQIKLVE